MLGRRINGRNQNVLDHEGGTYSGVTEHRDAPVHIVQHHARRQVVCDAINHQLIGAEALRCISLFNYSHSEVRNRGYPCRPAYIRGDLSDTACRLPRE